MQYLPGQYLFMITYFLKILIFKTEIITISSRCMHVNRDEAYHVHRYQNYYFSSKKLSLLWKCQNYSLRIPCFDLCLSLPAVKSKGSLSCKSCLDKELPTTLALVEGTAPTYSHLVSLSRINPNLDLAITKQVSSRL